LIVKDSRVSEEGNDQFLDLLEDYFAQPVDAVELVTKKIELQALV